MVRAGRDHFKVSSNNAFRRLVVWMKAKLLPASQTRRITEARERFIAAIGNRYGAEGGAAARDVLGASSKKPLRSRDIRRVFDALDRMRPGQRSPAPRESAASRTSVLRPEDPPGAKSATPATTEHATASAAAAQRSAIGCGPLGNPAGGAPGFRMKVDPQAGQHGVNGHSPDPLPAGGLFYRELQEAGTGLCGMHALNAFCGGPVVGSDEYKRMSIEITLDRMEVQGADRDALRTHLKADFASDPVVSGTLLARFAMDGRLDPACTHAAVETGVTIPDAADSPEAHAQVRARINAFPGDRLMVGYSRGDSGDAHLIALRREEGGHWQVLNSLKASTESPKRAANLADCLGALPKGLTIVHLHEEFNFQSSVAAPPAGEAAQVAAVPQRESADAPAGPPGPRENNLVAEGLQRRAPSANPLDDLPPPAYRESDLARMTAQVRGSTANPLDDLPPPAYRESDLARMAAQAHGSNAGPLDDPPAAAARPIDSAGVEVQGEARAGPLLQPYLRAGIPAEYAQPLLAAGLPPENAVPFLQQIARHGDTPREVFQSGIPLDLLIEAYRSGVGLREARLLHGANLPASIIQSAYAPYQVPIISDSIIQYTDGNVTRAPQVLGSGAFNTVYVVEHDDGERRIFKPLAVPDPNRQRSIERGWVAGETGIDTYDPRTAMRNLSTCRLADELGFDVIVRTRLGTHTLPGAVQGAGPQLGLVMEFAPGQAAFAYPTDTDVFERPEVRRELTKLQLLDCLTAQGDRHSGNYFIDVRPDGGVRVAGFDNDQCLGSKVRDPAVIRRGGRNEPGRGYRSCGLPPVIDTDMARTLLQFTPRRVHELLDDKLLPEEVDATVQRLTAIKNHIARLRQEGRIIEPDGWAGADVSVHTDYTNSYFARESAKNAGIAALGNAAAALDAMGY